MNQLVFGLLVLAIISACTNKQVYETIQTHKRLECQKLVRTAEYEKCMQEVSASYEEYTRNRDEVLKDGD